MSITTNSIIYRSTCLKTLKNAKQATDNNKHSALQFMVLQLNIAARYTAQQKY